MTITSYQSKGHIYLLRDDGLRGLVMDDIRDCWFTLRGSRLLCEGIKVTGGVEK